MTELREKTLRGIAWNIFGRASMELLAFVSGVVLARLLTPREFGLVAMVRVLTGFAQSVEELGLSAALIQRRDIDQVQLSSVFWLNIATGLVLMVIFAASSPFVAAFYNEPLLAPLTMLISVNFLITSFSIVPRTLAMRTLDFRRLSIAEVASVGASSLAAIVMAYYGLGVWSLAANSLGQATILGFLLWRFGDWRPGFTFKWGAVQNLMGFSCNLLATQTFNYWTRNIDNLLIGRILGPVPLGIYSRAYALMLLPVQNVSHVVGRVMFPSLSLINGDNSRVRELYLGMVRVIAVVTFPLMLGLFVTAEPFVLTVFGPQWTEMVPITRVLSLAGLWQSIGTLNGLLYLSQGRADLQFKVGVGLRAIVIAAIVIGLRWGIVGVAVSYALASLMISYPSFFFAGRLVGLTYADLLRNLCAAFIFSACMAVFVGLVGLLMPDDWPHWRRLGIQVFAGIVVFISLAEGGKLSGYQQLKHFLAEYLYSKRWNAKAE